MNERYIFHLSIPVSELAPAKRFYVEVLGARRGRENDEWLDILLWGHQITLQRRPEEILPLERQGKRHFGVILPWAEWELEAARIRSLGIPFLSEPEVLLIGTSEEQGKFYLQDTSHNVIELRHTEILRTRSVSMETGSRVRGPNPPLEPNNEIAGG